MIAMMSTLIIFSFQGPDIHSFSNPDEAVSTHLSLDLSLNFEHKAIDGICVLSMAYPSEKPPQFVDLDSWGLAVAKVEDGETGKVYPFTVGEATFMGSRLRISLLGDRPAKIKVTYRTGPGAGALQWLSPVQTTSKKYPFLFTQSQFILARTWIPCMDSPGVRVSYDAVVRVPKGLTAVMSAQHLAHQQEQGLFRFELKQPIPPYLIALAVGELQFKAISERTGVYAEPEVLEKAAWEFADMEKMVRETEALYGPYRWDRWDTIVLPPSFPFGGMENPTLTFATPTIIAGDRSLVSLMAHELAHSWSGNLVTNATWSDFWLNEGVTTYIENRIIEAIYGREIAQMQQLLGQRDLRDSVRDVGEENPKDTILKQDLAGRDPDDGYSDIPYEKGANFLRILEKQFGRETFDTFLKAYFDGHAFQSMTTEAFLQILKTKLFKGDEVLWQKLKVQEWVYSPGLPDNMVVPESDRFEKTGAAAEAFMRGGDLGGVRRDQWVTAEWMDFLNSLPETVDTEKLAKLDESFGFSKAGNSEILFAWFEVCIRNNYEPAFDALETFLTRQGRRKFLKPLYRAMQDNPATRAMGKRIYQKARPGYHPISANTIDAIVQ